MEQEAKARSHCAAQAAMACGRALLATIPELCRAIGEALILGTQPWDGILCAPKYGPMYIMCVVYTDDGSPPGLRIIFCKDRVPCRKRGALMCGAGGIARRESTLSG